MNCHYNWTIKRFFKKVLALRYQIKDLFHGKCSLCYSVIASTCFETHLECGHCVSSQSDMLLLQPSLYPLERQQNWLSSERVKPHQISEKFYILIQVLTTEPTLYSNLPPFTQSLCKRVKLPSVTVTKARYSARWTVSSNQNFES